jgi:hypothetical protein
VAIHRVFVAAKAKHLLSMNQEKKNHSSCLCCSESYEPGKKDLFEKKILGKKMRMQNFPEFTICIVQIAPKNSDAIAAATAAAEGAAAAAAAGSSRGRRKSPSITRSPRRRRRRSPLRRSRRGTPRPPAATATSRIDALRHRPGTDPARLIPARPENTRPGCPFIPARLWQGQDCQWSRWIPCRARLPGTAPGPGPGRAPGPLAGSSWSM